MPRPPTRPQRAPRSRPSAAGSYGLPFFAREPREVLGVVRKPPDYAGALLGRQRAVELDDEPPEVFVPGLVREDERLGAPPLGLVERLGKPVAEVRRRAVRPERRDHLLLPSPPVLEAQGDVALVGERKALDARLLVRRQIAGEVAEAVEHAMRLRPPAPFLVRGEELLFELPVVLGELALERRDLIGGERSEHRRRVLGRLGREPAVARAHAGETPGDVLRGDAAGGALARAAHQ